MPEVKWRKLVTREEPVKTRQKELTAKEARAIAERLYRFVECNWGILDSERADYEALFAFIDQK